MTEKGKKKKMVFWEKGVLYVLAEKRREKGKKRKVGAVFWGEGVVDVLA